MYVYVNILTIVIIIGFFYAPGFGSIGPIMLWGMSKHNLNPHFVAFCLSSGSISTIKSMAN